MSAIHQHPNLRLLSKFTEVNGNLYYEGRKVTLTDKETWSFAKINTALWLDASDQTTIAIATGISQISDKSGNSRHAIQSSASSQPSLISGGLNGKNIIRFDGSNDYLNFNGSFLIGVPYLIIGVFARSSGKNDNFLLGGSVSNTNQNLHIGWSGNTTLAHNQYFNDYNTSVSGYSSIEYAIFSFEKTASGSAIYKNGVSIATNTNTTYLTGYNGSAIGSRQDIGAYFQGDLCELGVLIGNNATSDNRILSEGYYAHKWLNNLPANHLYKTAPPYV